VTVQTHDFYRSSNGDRWQLVCDTSTGQRVVRHEPNLASGGQVTETSVEVFLDRTGSSPEHLALQSLLERLDIEKRAKTGASNPPVD
jgi:hypothetical protein